VARILITGGASYKLLAAAGHEYAVFDSLRSGRREFVGWGKLIESDIRNATALEVAFSLIRSFPMALEHHEQAHFLLTSGERALKGELQ
jgi:UDP-glucose 4-epimerase